MQYGWSFFACGFCSSRVWYCSSDKFTTLPTVRIVGGVVALHVQHTSALVVQLVEYPDCAKESVKKPLYRRAARYSMTQEADLMIYFLLAVSKRNRGVCLRTLGTA